MKSFFLVIGVFMFSLFVNAQESGTDAVVASVNMNVLYYGISNTIAIAVPGVKSDKVTATMTNGSIEKGLHGWEAKPYTQAESIITVLVDGKKVADKKFRVKMIPPPVAVFAGKSEGLIYKDVALKTDALDVELKNFLFDLKYTITGFVFFVSKDGMDYEEKSDSNKLNDKMKSLISGCESGKQIVFKNIKSIGPDGHLKELNDIIITIK
jgi:hypothetical protein